MIWLAEEVYTSGKGVIVYKNARKEKKKKNARNRMQLSRMK